jgi:uncharacterized membrane protein YphA (DoxX/SURF4 family)
MSTTRESIDLDSNPEVSDEAKSSLKTPAVRGVAWGLAARALLIYVFPRALSVLPFELFGIRPFGISRLWGAGLPYFQKYILQIDPSQLQSYGNLYSRISTLYDFTFAIVIAGIWLLLDRGRRHEKLIFESARIVARYASAGMLLYYGGEKLIGHQGGQSLQPERLVQPLGHINGWQAMMSWLSYSSLYAWFSGWAEAGAGLLMFSRRFTTLAAVLMFADMAMVWLINNSYWDRWGLAALAPIHFLPSALFLLAPHVTRFADMFVRNRSTRARFDLIIPPAWLRRGALALKVIVVPWVIYSEIVSSFWEGVSSSQRPPLTGLWRVEGFERNGTVEPLAYEYPHRWRDVGISPPSDGYIHVRMVNDVDAMLPIKWPEGTNELEDYTLEGRARNSKRRALLMSKSEGMLELAPPWPRAGEKPKVSPPDTLRYMIRDPGNVTITGKYKGDQLRVELRRIDIDTLPYFRFRWHPI